MQSADEYRQLIIAYKNGAPVRLGDVATVEQGAENSWLGAWANKQQAIVMNVQRQPGANIIATADSISQMLLQLTEKPGRSSNRLRSAYFPIAPPIFVPLLQTPSSVDAGDKALVVMIIYLFLRNVPATIIPQSPYRCR